MGIKYAASTRNFYDTDIHASIPSDAVDVTREDRAALCAGESDGRTIEPDANGRPVLVDPPAKTDEQLIASLTSAVQQHLDAEARTRNYDGILSLCTYATSTHPTFAAEGQAGVEWRDAVWAACYAAMQDVKDGNRPVPTPQALIAELPAMVWPT